MDEQNLKDGTELQADQIPDVQFVLFMIKDTEYAISISHVLEVIKIVPLTPLPEAPRFVKGVIHLRGSVIPVMDLRERFGIENSPVTKKTSIIIVKMKNSEIGIIVDAVTEVLNINADKIEPPLPVLEELKSEFVEGVAKVMRKLIMIINIEKILTAGGNSVWKEKKDEQQKV